MKVRKLFFVLVLSVSTLLLGCDWFGQEYEESFADYQKPVTLEEGEFLALAHLDEKSVREEREVTGSYRNRTEFSANI